MKVIGCVLILIFGASIASACSSKYSDAFNTWETKINGRYQDPPVPNRDMLNGNFDDEAEFVDRSFGYLLDKATLLNILRIHSNRGDSLWSRSYTAKMMDVQFWRKMDGFYAKFAAVGCVHDSRPRPIGPCRTGRAGDYIKIKIGRKYPLLLSDGAITYKQLGRLHSDIYYDWSRADVKMKALETRQRMDNNFLEQLRLLFNEA